MSGHAEHLPPARGAQPLLGVLGGMGPAATVDFLAKLVAATDAGTDQEHLRWVVWADPRVPDRTEALVAAGPDPTPLLEAGIGKLVAAGAELLAVPCNSAHAFVPEIARRAGIELVDMVDATVARVTASRSHERVGLLATTGTVQVRLYQDRFAAAGIETIEPSPREQAEVMAVIRAVKAGDRGVAVRRRAADAASRLARRGATVVAAACTELPLVVDSEDVGLPVLDTTLALATAAVARVQAAGARRDDRPRSAAARSA